MSSVALQEEFTSGVKKLNTQGGFLFAAFLFLLALPWAPCVLLRAAGTATLFPYTTVVCYSLLPSLVCLVALLYRRYVYGITWRYLSTRDVFLMLPLGILRHYTLLQAVGHPGASVRTYAFASILAELWVLPLMAASLAPPKPKGGHLVAALVAIPAYLLYVSADPASGGRGNLFVFVPAEYDSLRYALYATGSHVVYYTMGRYLSRFPRGPSGSPVGHGGESGSRGHGAGYWIERMAFKETGSVLLYPGGCACGCACVRVLVCACVCNPYTDA